MARARKDRKPSSLTRREFLEQARYAAALPLALVIPSRSRRVVTLEERMRPVKEREAAFDAELNRKLEQGARPGPGTKPPPPPPQKVPINTAYDTSKETRVTKATFSGKPERSDDTDYETHSDGSTTDYKTDYV